MSTQNEIEQFFHGACGELTDVTFVILIVKTMVLFDMNNRKRIWLKCSVTIDVGEDADLGVGAFLEQATKRSSIFRAPIDCQCRRTEALQLRHIVLRADGAFDGSGMRIREGMAVIGRKEVMRDAARIEAAVR